MGTYGGTRYGRESHTELRRRRMQIISYVLVAALAVATSVVVVLALNR